MGLTRTVRQFLGFSARHARASHVVTLTLLSMLATMLLPTTPAWAMFNPLLISRQTDDSDISAFTKWTALMPRYERERVLAQGQCIGTGCLNQQWEALLTRLKGKPLAVQMDAVNRFFNTMPYVSDNDNYGVADVWQTPYEMMEKGGDCEDYAIAKYISLKRLGVAQSAMRILVVRDINLDGAVHATLEVKIGNAVHILDNQSSTIVAAANVYHYDPIFAINESKWWSYR